MVRTREQKKKTEVFPVALRSGGTLALTVNDVSILLLERDDRAFVFELLDRLRAYEKSGPRLTNGADDDAVLAVGNDGTLVIGH